MERLRRVQRLENKLKETDAQLTKEQRTNLYKAILAPIKNTKPHLQQ